MKSRTTFSPRKLARNLDRDRYEIAATRAMRPEHQFKFLGRGARERLLAKLHTNATPFDQTQHSVDQKLG